MSRSIWTWKCAVPFFVVTVLSSAQMIGAAEDTSDTKAVENLSEALPIEDVLVLLDQYRVRPLMLESDFQVGGENIHDFYLNLAGKPADEIRAGYENARRAFLEDMLRLNAAATVFPDYVRNQQREMQNVLRMGDYRRIKVSKVTIKGRSHDVKRFVLREGLKSGLGKTPLGKDSRRDQIQKPTITTEPATVVDSTWYPNSGTTITDQSSTSERYVTQFMTWTNVSFGAEETYEHDFRLYNYDNDGTYFTMDTNFYPDCLPVAYVSTTWPAAAKPYLDTRFDGFECEDDEPAYTIGAARANALASGAIYQTYMRFANGNVGQDKFKLQAQRGHRFPSSCEDTWCSYSDEFITLVPAWNDKVPGLVNWSHPAPSLSVSLTANPTNGSAPLNDVDLTASVGGTVTGTINYTFYCNRDDSGTNITPNPDAKYDGISTNPKTALKICDYTVPGTYTAKVIAERGSSAAEHRTTIVVGAPSSQAPAVATNSASSVTQESASLNLTVNPNGSATDIWFDWDSDTSFCCSTPHRGIGSGTTSSLASMTLDGLACNTTYYFRARAQNAIGSALPGQVLSFKTSVCGGGGSETSNIVRNGDFLDDDSFWVRSGSFYADDRFNISHDSPGYAYLSNSDGSPGNNLFGTIYQQILIPTDATSAMLSFWTRITTSEPAGGPAEDFLNATLQDSGGNFRGSLSIYSNQNASGSYVKREFNLVNFIGETVRIHFLGTTNNDGQPTVFRIDDVRLDVIRPIASAPTVTTEAADQVTVTSVRLNLTVDPNSATTTVWFDLEPGDSTPDDDTEHIIVGSGSQSEPISISAFGLQCGTLYYFRAQASNSEGSDNGSVRSFTTLPCSGGAPHADTDPAEDVTQTSARLTADVGPNGLTTQAWFAWGSTQSLGQETPHVSVGSGTTSVDFTQTLSGLTCGITYYFQNHASNSAGQDSGATHSFETLACGGGGSSAPGFFLDSRRQGCSGGVPAELLWWTAPAGMGNVFTVRRTDGAYTATVNSSQGGMVHLVSSLLVPGETYSFYIEGTLNGSSVQTNVITVPVISDECRLPVGAGELPHMPLLWAGPPFCSSGTASLPIQWTAVGGAASYTLTRIDNVAAQLTPYPNLTGTSLTDSGLRPGAAYEYMLEAMGSGGARQAERFTIYVPSGICGEPSTPGPFSAQVSSPVCDAGKGALTLSWTSASGAASKTRTYWSDDGFTSGSGTTFTGSSHYINGLRSGALVKLMVQAEAASTPLQYRSVILSQRIPLDVCGAGTLAPTVTNLGATYIQERQALLRAAIIPNADSSIAFFDWGTSTIYGSTTPTRNAGDGYRSASLGETLTGLTCNTTYHFRGVAVNAHGRTDGVDQSFTTPACTVPVVSISATDATATENPMTSGTFLIQRTGSTAGSLAVTYTVGGTATVGIDHTLGAGSITIPAGAASQTLTVFPLDDSLVESDETVVVTLQPQSQYVVGSPSSATVTIASDEVPGGGCGRILVDQARDQIGGCDASDTGIQWWVAENFRLADRRDVSCLEVLGYYWPGNNPPPSSLFDVVFYAVAGSGAPGAVVHEDRGIHVLRQKTGNVSSGMEEWRFTVELTTPVELAAGNYFVEIAGAAGTGGSFCWSEGQIDPVAGLGGLAFRQTGQWSLGNWSLAFKVFEAKPQASDFYTVTPCRVADTRNPTGPFGGPALSSGNLRVFTLTGRCGVPVGADAVAMNVTVVGAGGTGNLTIFPGDQVVPGTSSISFFTGQTRANNSIMKLSSSGTLGVWPTLGGNGQVHFIIDVVGYFATHGLTGLRQDSTAEHPNSSLDDPK